jgi:structure-specific endonuclease subunit SLX1
MNSDDKSYIGFSTNYKRRLRQHNGEIVGGAKKTRKSKQWKLVCVVAGFQSKHDALAFEWAFQHPYKSRKYQDAAVLKGKRGVGRIGSIGRRVLELHLMLQNHPELTVLYHPDFENIEIERRVVIPYSLLL